MTSSERKAGRVPLSHRAENLVRQYIIDNRLRPGDPLPSEGDFCVLLDMSKASVREGLRRLELLGIVEVRHGRGLFVGAFTLDAVVDALPYQLRVDETPLREILQVRASMEEGLIFQASQLMTDEHLKHLDHLVAQMRERSVAGEVAADVDRAFHLALFAPLGNSLLLKLIAVFWDVYDRFATSETTQINIHAVEDHAEIVNALRSGEHDRMTRAIALHFAPIQGEIGAAILHRQPTAEVP